MPSLSIIPERALKDPEMTGARLFALCAIGTFTSRDGKNVWAANETIAARANMDEREYRRCAAWLVERGYVRKRARWKKDGGRDTNLLQIVLDDPIEVAGVGAESAPTSGELSPSGGGAESPRGVGAESTPTPGVDAPPTGRGNVPHQTSPLNETASPPAAGADRATLAGEFAHAEHRAAYEALRAKHRQPAILDAGLRAVHAPPTGGAGYAWEVIGAGLLEQLSNDETFNVSRLRGYCRSHVAGAPPSTRRNSSAPSGDGAAVRVGTQLLAPAHVWTLCVEHGLAARGQSREALAERIEELVRDGRVQDGDAFLALVLHVKPWQLNQIAFAKAREDQLAERLATWRNGEGRAIA